MAYSLLDERRIVIESIQWSGVQMLGTVCPIKREGAIRSFSTTEKSNEDK
jgi:hypothetical protein